MECNRDEAQRAKDIAESKFSAKDIMGANKFALKAQSLYPDLDGISQFKAILDVYVAAENKINGELDFYGILGVSPSADDDTVRKHYRKLVLSLHPDKNKSIGADGAFKYVSEAWNFLSDKDKRSTYDHKRNARVFKQKKVQTQNGGSGAPMPPRQNGFYNFTKSTVTRTKGTTAQTKESNSPRGNTNATIKTGPTSVPSSSNKQTAPKVQTQNGGSTAPMPPRQNGLYNFTKSTITRTKGKTSKTKDTTNSSRHNTNGTSKTDSTSVPSSSNKQTAPKTFWTVCKRCKLQYEFSRMYLNRNLLCPTCRGPFLAVETPPPNTDSSSEVLKKVQGASKNVSNPGTSKTKGVEPCHGDSSNHTSSQCGPFSKMTSPAAVGQAVKRDREEVQGATERKEVLRRKISKNAASRRFNSVKIKQDVNGLGANKETGPVGCSISSGQVEVKKDASNAGIKNQLMKKATMEIRKKLHEWSSETVIDSVVGGVGDTRDSKNHQIEPLVTDVPDPDFHDFDCHRSESCFEEGEVWAAYDDHDGMPRYYAMILKVFSLDPFKMKVCWLHSIPDDNPGLFSGFSKAFGEFRAGKYEIVSVPNYFSHKANFTEQANGNIRVFPRKGDVCALYWNDQKPHLVKHKYEIVEVDEYDDETDITITPLVKVANFKTVFHRHLNPDETRVVPENEISRFSHQIPSYWLTGQESPCATKGCRELDPAAVPPEILQVTENVKVEDDQMLDKDCVLADFKEVVNLDDEECSK